MTILEVKKLPDCQKERDGTTPRMAQILTADNLVHVLEALNMRLRFNMMTQRTVVCIGDVELDADATETAKVMVSDTLKRLDIKSQGGLDNMLRVLAIQDKYHPMEEWLKSLPPAAGDPIGDLIESVTADGELWPIALETWLTMVVEAVCGWRTAGPTRSLQYCLVLQGPQGIGKTQFFAKLGGDYIKTEAEVQLGSSVNAEDSQIRTLRWSMVELAELDGMTRKQDVADMKAFLSRPVDDLRRKYGADAALVPRMTAFCGTVNVGQFLVDQSGNRRYLPVHVTAFDWGFDIDLAGVWSAAYALWQAEGFRDLDAGEEAIRQAEAERFTQQTPEQEAIDGQFTNLGESWDQYFAVGRRDICLALGLGTRMMNTGAVGEYMTKLFGEETKHMGKRSSWLVPLNIEQQSRVHNLTPVGATYAKRKNKWAVS